MWWCHVAHSTFYPKMFNHLSHGETYLSDIFRFRPTNCLRTSMLVTLSSTCLTGYKAMVLSLERIRRKSTKLSHTLKWISVLSSCKPTVVHQSPLYYSRHWFAFITPSQHTILDPKHHKYIWGTLSRNCPNVKKEVDSRAPERRAIASQFTVLCHWCSSSNKRIYTVVKNMPPPHCWFN